MLKGVARDEVGDLNADRIEPDLPTPKNGDGFLAELQPIEYVG